jgi:hypothetical protein
MRKRAAMKRETGGWTPASILGALRARRLCCSFCHRRASEVDRLVAGASAYICDVCITTCVEILKEHGGIRPADTHH